MPLLAGVFGGIGSGLLKRLRRMLISGAAVTVPLVVTLLVLAFAVNFVLEIISPVVSVVADTFEVGRDLSGLVKEGIAVVVLLVTTLVIGFVAETRSGDGLERAFDAAMARIPGIGSVYTSFNEMSKMLLANDTQSFKEVKLVEYPAEGAYTIGFVTADTPGDIETATGYEKMTTLFMPMAPNPVMGGFVMHISTDRVHDVDLSVEEGIRSIVTSGVATGSERTSHEGELVDFGRLREQARDGVSDLGAFSQRTASDVRAVTAEDFERLKSQTSDRLDVIRGDSEDDEAVHYMLEQTDDAPGEGESGEQPNTDASADSAGSSGPAEEQ